MEISVLVHGYRLNSAGGLGKESLVIVTKTANVYNNLFETPEIILLGGWDESNKGRGESIAEIMRRALLPRGVAGKAIKNWKEIFPEKLGPRDTMEEVDLAKKIQEKEPERMLFAVCTWGSFFRVKLLYRRARMRIRVIPVWAGESPWQMLLQIIFLGVTLLYPHLGTRALIEKNRGERTPKNI